MRIRRKVPPSIMVADPMNLWNKYYIAKSVPDALRTLLESRGTARIVAGGTDMLLDLQQGRVDPVHLLVDVSEIPEMRRIEIRQGELFIGASVTQCEISQSIIIRKHANALSTASGMIGGPQVRNTATIGGNVAHALPAADGSIALMALDATVEIVSSAGTRRLPMADLFLGPGKSILHHGSQILTGFYINLRQSGQASAFRRIMRPQGVAIAILNVAVWLQRNGDILDDIRISIGPSGPVPRRLSAMEMALRGRDINVESLSDAKSAMLNETNFRTSRHRSTREYRQDMAEVLFEETLLSAFKSAKGG